MTPPSWKRRRHPDRSLRPDAAVAHDGRQPLVEKVEVEQVHEIDDPNQQGHHATAVREQPHDRKPCRILRAHSVGLHRNRTRRQQGHRGNGDRNGNGAAGEKDGRPAESRDQFGREETAEGRAEREPSSPAPARSPAPPICKNRRRLYCLSTKPAPTRSSPSPPLKTHVDYSRSPAHLYPGGHHLCLFLQSTCSYTDVYACLSQGFLSEFTEWPDSLVFPAVLPRSRGAHFARVYESVVLAIARTIDVCAHR